MLLKFLDNLFGLSNYRWWRYSQNENKVLISRDGTTRWVSDDHVLRQSEKILAKDLVRVPQYANGIMYQINEQYVIMSFKNKSLLDNWIRKYWNDSAMSEPTVISNSCIEALPASYIEQVCNGDENLPL
jgi:hypothetical protein